MYKRIDLNRWLTELVIIVLGILIALSVDEYRDYLNDRELEQTYLNSLLQDLNADLSEMDSIFKEIDARIESGKYLKSISSDDDFSDLTKIRKIMWSINSTGFFAVHKPSRLTIDDLISSGKLEIIENIQLKRNIQSYYQNWILRHDYDDWSRVLVWQEFRNEYTRLVPYELIAALGNEEKTLAVAPEALHKLFSNQDFLYRLDNAHGITEWQKGRYDNFKKELEELISELETEIHNG